MRNLAIAAAAVAAAFLPGHLAILAILAWLAVTRMSGTSKSRSTEARVTALEGQVATNSTNVQAAQTAATAAQTAASNALPKSGGTLTGNLTIQGTLTTTGNIGCQGGTVYLGAGSQASITEQDFNMSPPMGAPPNYPLQHISTTPTAAEFNAVEDCVNAVFQELGARGMLAQ